VWIKLAVLTEKSGTAGVGYARMYSALQLNARRLIARVEAGAYATRLREDFMSGIRGGVNGTPTFFINGIRYDGERALNALLDAVTVR